MADYDAGDTTSIFLNLRVADIQSCYQEWKGKGAEFVTPPIDRGAEIRCYMRNPDGYLIEVGQSTGAARQVRREAPGGPAGRPSKTSSASLRRAQPCEAATRRPIRERSI